MIVNVLTVDVEEYYHAAIFRRGAKTLAGSTSRAGSNGAWSFCSTFCAGHRTRATFFVLGEVAAAHPHLMRTVVAEQHEIACHGDRHEDVYRQSPDEFRHDIRRAKAQIEEVIGRPSSAIGRRTSPLAARSHGPTTFSPRRAFRTTRASIRFITTATASRTRCDFRTRSGEAAPPA